GGAHLPHHSLVSAVPNLVMLASRTANSRRLVRFLTSGISRTLLRDAGAGKGSRPPSPMVGKVPWDRTFRHCGVPSFAPYWMSGRHIAEPDTTGSASNRPRSQSFLSTPEKIPAAEANH